MKIESVANVESWHPAFRQTLDAAISELMLAKNHMDEGTLRQADALQAATRAEDHLGYLLVEWEDTPEPARDVIRGVLFEVRGILKVMNDADRKYGLDPNDNITGRLLDSIKGLEALDNMSGT